MIFIDRNRQINGRAIHPGDRWQDAAKQATEDAEREGAEHEVRRSIYAHESARAAMEALTHMKCAYCEVSLARFDWDVEHYRPKGRVRERRDHPGYYWLAYDWENLLPSCTYCNQNRKERPTFEDPVPGESGGKHDQFPIADETKRAMSPGDDYSLEEPLLIDPSIEDPSDHLGYFPAGGMFALGASRKGETSIRIFRLNLRRIVNERRRDLAIVRQVMQMRNRAVERGEAAAAAEAEDILSSLAADDRPFAGMVRYFMENPEALDVG